MSLIEISVFFTSACAEETDGEQGMEHTTVTNDAATAHVPDRVAPPAVFTCNGTCNFVTFFHVLFCEQDTPNAFLRQIPRPWTNACFDQRTQEFFDERHNQSDLASVASLFARPEPEDPTGDKTSLKIAARAATFFSVRTVVYRSRKTR